MRHFFTQVCGGRYQSFPAGFFLALNKSFLSKYIFCFFFQVPGYWTQMFKHRHQILKEQRLSTMISKQFNWAIIGTNILSFSSIHSTCKSFEEKKNRNFAKFLLIFLLSVHLFVLPKLLHLAIELMNFVLWVLKLLEFRLIRILAI